MRYVLSNHVKSHFLKPPITKDIAVAPIPELQRTLTFSKSTMTPRSLLKVEEFAKRRAVEPSYRSTIRANIAQFVGPKEELYDMYWSQRREFLASNQNKWIEDAKLGYFSSYFDEWYCNLCGFPIVTKLRPELVKKHYEIVHEYALTVAALARDG